MRALGLAFFHWGDTWETRASNSASSFTWDANFGLCVLVLQWCWDAAFMLRVLVIAVILRHGFQSSHLDAMLVAMISLASGFWTLLFDDLSSVIFRQPTESPPKFFIFRGWLGRILKYFGLWLNSYFSWLDWQSFEMPWAWSCLECGLLECTVKPFEATRDDHGECLDT